MKIKLAIQLVIIGVILQIITAIVWSLLSTNVLTYGAWSPYMNILFLIGITLLLPFFITLYKNQKKQ